MTPVQQFEAWRAELVIELEETSQNLAAERARLAVAEAAYGEAKDAREALQRFAKDALKQLSDNAIAAPLHFRLATVPETLKAAQGERGAARASVKAFDEQLARLRNAIAQIDIALTADKVTALRPNAAPARRQPQPIEFDNIVKVIKEPTAR